MISYACICITVNTSMIYIYIYMCSQQLQYNHFEKAMFGTGVISKFFWLLITGLLDFFQQTQTVCGKVSSSCAFVIGICQKLVAVEPTIICLLYCLLYITWRCPCHDGPWHEQKATLLQLWPSQSSSLPQSHSSFVIFERSKCSSMCDSNWWFVLRLPHSLSW